MAFYSQVPPIQLYAYAPMAIPNQPEFYAVYPSGSAAGVVDASAFYYDGNPKGMMGQSGEEITFSSKCNLNLVLLPASPSVFTQPCAQPWPESQ